MKEGEGMQTIVTSSRPKCYHKNGWFKVVTFTWWMFDFRRKYFLCTDCEDLIPLEEADEIRKSFKN